MLDNPIYTNNPNVKGSNPGLKTAEYQTVKGMRFGIKWLGIAFASTISVIRDAVKMAFGRG